MSNEREPFAERHEVYLTHQAVQQHVAGLVIRYGITLDGPEVEWTHSDMDGSLPAHTVRVRTGGHELLLRSEEWVGRTDEVRPRVFGWLLAHVDLHAAKLQTDSKRLAPEWLQAWHQVHPDG